MATTSRSGFAWGTLVVALAIFAALMALLFPAIQAAREAARRNKCTCHVHQLGIALQNYHDSFKRFPALSTEPFPQPLGSTSQPVAGFSWLTLVLPYLEEGPLYQGIAMTSGQFASGTPA